MIRIAICDDEPALVKKLNNMVDNVLTSLEISYQIFSFLSGEELMSSTSLRDYDIIFLDIDMPEPNGMTTAMHLQSTIKNPIILFVTNRDDMVYESFKYRPFRFIRKSKLDSELLEAITDFLKLQNKKEQVINLSIKGQNIKIDIGEVLYFEVIGHDITCYMTNETIHLRETLSTIEEHVANLSFVRTHKSYLLNIKYIFSIEKDHVLLYDNKTKIPLSKHRRTDVKEAFVDFMGKE